MKPSEAHISLQIMLLLFQVIVSAVRGQDSRKGESCDKNSCWTTKPNESWGPWFSSVHTVTPLKNSEGGPCDPTLSSLCLAEMQILLSYGIFEVLHPSLSQSGKDYPDDSCPTLNSNDQAPSRSNELLKYVASFYLQLIFKEAFTVFLKH